MECKEADKLISLYLDGEFSDQDSFDLHEHLEHCQRCSHILEEEKVLKEALGKIRLASAPPDLRSAILRSLEKESRGIRLGNFWRLSVGFAGVAGAVALVWVVARNGQVREKRIHVANRCLPTAQEAKRMIPMSRKVALHKGVQPAPGRGGMPTAPVKLVSAATGAAKASNVRARVHKESGLLSSRVRKMRRRTLLSPRMMENLVVDHVRPLPVEVRVRDPKRIARWYSRRTGLYTPPPRFTKMGGAIEGGRFSRLNGDEAVQLMYRIKGRRVTLFMFNPKMMPGLLHIRNTTHLQELTDGQVLLDTPGGRTVALFAHKGVGYSLITDLERPVVRKLVQTILRR